MTTNSSDQRKIGKNETLLHYEELGGVDFKVTITLFLITKYVMATTGYAEGKSKAIAKAMKDETRGWDEVMSDDERFYEWCKRRFRSQVVAQIARSHKELSVYWYAEDGDGGMTVYHIRCEEARALSIYKRLAKTRVPVAVFVRDMNGSLHSNPIRRHNANYLLTKIPEYEEKNPFATSGMSELEACRKKRGVRKCASCCRYEVEWPYGCPFYGGKPQYEESENEEGEKQ